MEMVERKTAELKGAALDWAVAKVEGWQVEMSPVGLYRDASTGRKEKATGYRLWMVSDVEPCECTPSSDWSQGGPLLDKYPMETRACAGTYKGIYAVLLSIDEDFGVTDARWADGYAEGRTVLIAACRAIVAAHLGDTVQIPSELA